MHCKMNWLAHPMNWQHLQVTIMPWKVNWQYHMLITIMLWKMNLISHPRNMIEATVYLMLVFAKWKLLLPGCLFRHEFDVFAKWKLLLLGDLFRAFVPYI